MTETGTDYGPFADLVRYGGCALAAAVALRLGWMRREGSRWSPPEEAVSKGTTKVSALATAVLLGLLLVFLSGRSNAPVLGVLAITFLALALFGLLASVYLMNAHGFPDAGRGKWHGTKLGGDQLTDEAKKISQGRSVTPDRLVEEAGGNVRLVFTQPSIAKIHTLATFFFVLLQAFGSLALGSIGLLLATTR